MEKNSDDVLVIKRWNSGNTDYMLPLKITVDLHAQVKAIAKESNQPLSKVACQLIEFALAHVEVED
jgi:hypothetical protein